ncbi:hypothetical protein BJX99DRAFT_138824 [Aspergillus californicus]
MASIKSLLNPLPDLSRSDRFPLPTPSPTSSTSTIIMRSPRQKKQKMAKDAPVFNRGRPRGEVRYPPHEERDDELARVHRDFRIHPFGNIAEFPRHIPYNSDKKSFQELTGRESFEVFQYTFEVPGEDKLWTVMWDYNIGLVRTTALFKCNHYSKTTPAKMLNQNPGLRDICHSITGGALAAQGYWMPFEAAKAVATTFCWKIRFTLTPIFGTDFPSLCIPPNDVPRFGRMVIDASVIKTATERSSYYRMLELRSPPLHSLRAGYRPSSAEDVALGRHILPKSHRHHHRRSDTSTDRSIGYGSSPHYSSSTEPYCLSPVSPIRSAFTPVNTPRSTDMYTSLPSPHEVLASLSRRTIPSSVPSTHATKTSLMEGSDADADADADAETDLESISDDSTFSTLYSSTGSGSSGSLAPDEMNTSPDDDESYRDSDADMDGRAPKQTTKRTRGRKTQGTTTEKEHPTSEPRAHVKSHTSRIHSEIRAAHALLSLHMQDALGSDADAEYELDLDADADIDAHADLVDFDVVVAKPPPVTNTVFAATDPFIWNGRKRRRASA